MRASLSFLDSQNLTWHSTPTTQQLQPKPLRFAQHILGTLHFGEQRLERVLDQRSLDCIVQLFFSPTPAHVVLVIFWRMSGQERGCEGTYPFFVGGKVSAQTSLYRQRRARFLPR